MSSRILIADDHEMVRRGIRSLLEARHDFEVSEARDGRQAVDKTIELKPDLVILDVAMPLLDGFSAAREIKKNRAGDGHSDFDFSEDRHSQRSSAPDRRECLSGQGRRWENLVKRY